MLAVAPVGLCTILSASPSYEEVEPVEAMLTDLEVEGGGLGSEDEEPNLCSLFCLTKSRSAVVPLAADVDVLSFWVLREAPGPGIKTEQTKSSTVETH